MSKKKNLTISNLFFILSPDEKIIRQKEKKNLITTNLFSILSTDVLPLIPELISLRKKGTHYIPII